MLKHNRQYQINNTFGLNCSAAEIFECCTKEDVQKAIENAAYKPIIIGCGSNLILPEFLKRSVIQIVSNQYSIIENKEYFFVEVDAGLNWDAFVSTMIESGIYGLENLAAIPGSCGAAPVQNIGAYGVEVSEFISQVHGIDIDTMAYRSLTKNECLFSYRESIFKHELFDKFIITSIELKIPKIWQPRLSYSNLSKTLSAASSSREIYDEITKIRWSKLPNPMELGNAGSFFKNPILPFKEAERIISQFPEIVCFEGKEGIKFAAAWLIEQCGFKGDKSQTVGMYEKQALVMVNHKDANLKDVVTLKEQIQSKVFNKFGILLEAEPRIIS